MGSSRVGVVLAASAGLGRATAEALGAQGYRLVICSRSPESLQRTVKELKTAGCAVEGRIADVSRPEDVTALIEWSVERHGQLDVLVANAGGPPAGDFDQVDPTDWDTAYRLTLMSAVTAIRAARPHLSVSKHGRIVIIGSSSVRRPLDGLVLSNTFRPALQGLTASLAVELGSEGITVNMVSPGKIDTERVQSLDSMRAERMGTTAEQVRSQTEAKIPVGRYGRPDELAAVIQFLASEPASYVTGQSIVVDGGLVPSLS